MNINEILAEREKTHGDFKDHAKLSQNLKEVARSSKNWANLQDFQKEAIEMSLHKLARILSGNAKYIDSWRDMAAYIELARGELSAQDGALDSIVSYIKNKNGAWQTCEKGS
nr:hypothetical protein [uncultured Campylobacter sp.]